MIFSRARGHINQPKQSKATKYPVGRQKEDATTAAAMTIVKHGWGGWEGGRAGGRGMGARRGRVRGRNKRGKYDEITKQKQREDS